MRGEDVRNEGIIQHGGSLRGDVIAVGRQARAVKILATADDALRQKGLQDIHDRLQEVVHALTQHADSLKNPDEIFDSAQAVAEELSKDKPNKLTINSVLEGIANGVKSVATVATAVEALRSAVMALR